MSERAGEFNWRSITVAIACCGGTFAGPGPMLVAGVGLLMTAISAEYDWSRTMFATIPLITAWTAALSAPVGGRLMDRYGLRRVLLPGTLMFGLSLLLVGLLASETWHFFLAYPLIGLVSGLQGPVGYSKILSQWFSRHRGVMLAAVAALGSGLGYALTPIAFNYAIEHHGWRAGYVTAAVIIGLSFPLSFLFLRERSDRTATASAAGHHVAEGVDRGEALRTVAFWQLVILLFLGANAFYGAMVHLFPLLLDRGVDRGVAALALSMIAVGSIIGQVVAGVLLDRIDTPRVAVIFFFSGLVAITLLQAGGGHGTIMTAALLLGFGQGAELSVLAYLVTRIFGLKSFGALYGLVYAAANLAGGSGPMLMGLTFDRWGSYGPMLYVFQGLLAASCALILLLPPYRYAGRGKAN